MVKYLPIGYPHQCPHRGGMSKNFCHFQGRSYSIRCQGHWNEFPEDCPLTTANNSDNSEEKQNDQPTQGNTSQASPQGEIAACANRLCSYEYTDDKNGNLVREVEQRLRRLLLP